VTTEVLGGGPGRIGSPGSAEEGEVCLILGDRSSNNIIRFTLVTSIYDHITLDNENYPNGTIQSTGGASVSTLNKAIYLTLYVFHIQ